MNNRKPILPPYSETELVNMLKAVRAHKAAEAAAAPAPVKLSPESKAQIVALRRQLSATRRQMLADHRRVDREMQKAWHQMKAEKRAYETLEADTLREIHRIECGKPIEALGAPVKAIASTKATKALLANNTK